MLPIPKRLLGQGVRDMIRISDARMSGTSYGACILHVAPESFVGGPLAFVQTGDEIEIDVDKRADPSARQRRRTRPPQGGLDEAARRNIRAATGRSIRIISARPTRAAISISSAPAARSPSRKFINRYRPQDDGMMLTTAQKVRAFAIAIGSGIGRRAGLGANLSEQPRPPDRRLCGRRHRRRGGAHRRAQALDCARPVGDRGKSRRGERRHRRAQRRHRYARRA